MATAITSMTSTAAIMEGAIKLAIVVIFIVIPIAARSSSMDMDDISPSTSTQLEPSKIVRTSALSPLYLHAYATPHASHL